MDVYREWWGMDLGRVESSCPTPPSTWRGKGLLLLDDPTRRNRRRYLPTYQHPVLNCYLPTQDTTPRSHDTRGVGMLFSLSALGRICWLAGRIAGRRQCMHQSLGKLNRFPYNQATLQLWWNNRLFMQSLPTTYLKQPLNCHGSEQAEQGRVRIWRVLWMSRCESKVNERVCPVRSTWHIKLNAFVEKLHVEFQSLLVLACPCMVQCNSYVS